MTDYAIVIPTIGRPSLSTLLRSIVDGPGPLPREVVVVDDRPGRPTAVETPAALRGRLRLVAAAGQGPAAARNRGWRCTTAPWVVFLDDDVVVAAGWRAALAEDLAVGAGVGGVSGRIVVPAPAGRRPTDWQRQVMALADAPWITADIAYRRSVLVCTGGFDEAFPGAFREDSDLAARVRMLGYDLVRGNRAAMHPIGPARAWASVDRQRGNADDALLRRRYGRRWRSVTGVPRGRRTGHAATTLAALLAVLGLLFRRRTLARGAGLAWLCLTAELAVRRIVAGPASAAEVATMALTSAAIPPAATAHWLRGWWRYRHVHRMPAVPASAMGRALW